MLQHNVYNDLHTTPERSAEYSMGVQALLRGNNNIYNKSRASIMITPNDETLLEIYTLKTSNNLALKDVSINRPERKSTRTSVPNLDDK